MAARAFLDTVLRQLRRAARLDLHPRPATPVRGLGLALGGGFARGFAHIGVLQVLEENGVPIAGIAGTSVGSMIGAAYASGVPVARIAEVCSQLQFKNIGRWKVSRMGLASNERLGEIIERCFGGRTFEEMKIPLAVVTTDLETGEPVIFTRGGLVEPIRASCAFPGLFEPVRIGDRLLTDGGLTALVPTKAAAGLGVRHVLGVSVGFNNWHAGPPTNVFQVISRALSITQKHRSPSWERFADIVLEPEVQHVEWDEFHRAEETIAAGAAAMRRAMPRVRELLHLSDSVTREIRAHRRTAEVA